MADLKQGESTKDTTQMVRSETTTVTPDGGVVHQVRTMAAGVHQRVMAMPATRRTWVLGALLFLAAGCAGLAWFFERPDYRELFTGLDGKDVQTVASELGAAGIPFETTGDGIKVPADLMDKARMEVAAKGMPQTGRLGFELFDKPNWVGSEFDERVNYQRALEGELERTIGSLGTVRSAHVHVVMPQQSLFTTQERVAKASVVLRLRKASMSPEQAEAIRGLVAGAVENLSPENVMLADADGRVNLQQRGRGSAAEADTEQALEAKLMAMLEPLAGHENVRATVNVSYDEGTEERTDQIYDPTQSVALSSRKSEQSSGAGKGAASGIPGTASNTPAAAPAGSQAAAGAAVAAGAPPLLKEPLPVYPGGAAGGQVSKEESMTNGVTTHTIHSEQGPGRIRRVTAAVVVNDKQVVEGTGKTQQTVWKPRSAEEMKRLEALAQAAVGFDEKRGDQVAVSNVSFSTNAPETALGGMAKVLDEGKGFLHTEPAVLRTGVMGLVALMVVMMVLRPVAKQVTTTLRQPVLLASGTPMGTVSAPDAEAAATLGKGAESAGALGTGAQAAAEIPVVEELVASPQTMKKRRAAKQGQMMFDHVSQQIMKEPVQSTRLLEVWIGTQEGAE